MISFKLLWFLGFLSAKHPNRNCSRGLGGLQGGSFGSVLLSLSLFCLWIGPHWPLADSREAILQCRQSERAKEGANFMGTESEAGSALKKRAGEAVSVFKSSWGSVQWLPNSDTHTHTDHTVPNTTHKHCHALMHRLTHAHKHKHTSCELWINSLLTCKHTHSHIHSNALWVSGIGIMGMILSSVIPLAAILR